ncbi:division plane positioning ATPase MipZ, partial [Palleronia sp.]|uniref:division plane positioning ATPase MipZ n=1 Tax=Palleronia sp. TaxID=1940284 RepID=UPI0035C7D64E
MKTIAVISQKGGSGKSTISRHAAAMLPRAALVDLDPQGTSRRWIERRRDAGNQDPGFTVAKWDKLQGIHRTLTERGADYLIIDTPPSHDDERAIRSAIALSDLVILPVKPTPEDIEVLGGVEALIGSKPKIYVMTMITPRSNLFATTRRLLEKRGRVAPSSIVN